MEDAAATSVSSLQQVLLSQDDPIALFDQMVAAVLGPRYSGTKTGPCQSQAHFQSSIKYFRRPILPPRMTREQRLEVEHVRNRAAEIDQRSRLARNQSSHSGLVRERNQHGDLECELATIEASSQTHSRQEGKHVPGMPEPVAFPAVSVRITSPSNDPLSASEVLRSAFPAAYTAMDGTYQGHNVASDPIYHDGLRQSRLYDTFPLEHHERAQHRPNRIRSGTYTRHSLSSKDPFARLTARARGYLTRRVLACSRPTELAGVIKDCLDVLGQLDAMPKATRSKNDQFLIDGTRHQLSTAREEFHFLMSHHELWPELLQRERAIKARATDATAGTSRKQGQLSAATRRRRSQQPSSVSSSSNRRGNGSSRSQTASRNKESTPVRGFTNHSSQSARGGRLDTSQRSQAAPKSASSARKARTAPKQPRSMIPRKVAS